MRPRTQVRSILTAGLLGLAITFPAAAQQPPPTAGKGAPVGPLEDAYGRQYLEQARQLADQNRFMVLPAAPDPRLKPLEQYATPAPNMEPRVVHCDQVQAAWEKLARHGYCTPDLSDKAQSWWRQQCPNLKMPGSAPSCKRPNVLIFLVDDMGWGDFGIYGGGETVGAATPNVDRLAHEGLLLSSTYAQPSCSPTRATIHTGQLPIHHGVLDPPMYGAPGGITRESKPFPLFLKDKGYVTRGVGKWHLGEGLKNLPTVLGYDEYYGFLNVSDMYSEWRDDHYNPEVAWDQERTQFMQQVAFNHFLIYAKAGGKPEEQCQSLAEITTPEQSHAGVPPRGYFKPCEKAQNAGQVSISDLDQLWADYSVKFIREEGELHKSNPGAAPWYLYHATRGCHFDNYPRPEFQRASYARTSYGDCTVEIDYTLGRLLEALRASGQEEDTLVFFTSDNGPEREIPFHAHTPFRGAKGDTWEGGMRVPGIAHWKGMIEPGRRSDGLFDLADLYPTILELAGFDFQSASLAPNSPVADHYLYGIDQTSFLLDDHGASNRRSELYWYLTHFAAVRMDEFKAHRMVSEVVGLREGNIGGFSGVNLPTSYLWLFNLQDDPKEQNNIFIRHLWNNGLFTGEFRRFLCTLINYPPHLPTEPASEIFYDQDIQAIKDHPAVWKEMCKSQAHPLTGS